jgi:hypothetical protein
MTKNIIAGLEIIIGVLFLFSMASDIQLGFGLVLIALGVNHLSRQG